jgi:transposase
MKRLNSQEFAAFVGLDWADVEPHVCLQAADADTREASVVQHTPEAIDAWVHTLRQRFPGKPIAVCLALSKGPLVSALRTYDFVVLFPVHPLTVARYREAFTPSHAQDDPSDAALQLALLLKHRDQVQPLRPQSPTLRALEQLVEHRRRVGGEKVRLTNRLTSTLTHYFPHPLQWFHDKDTALFCDFLDHFPTLQAVQQARRTTPERFFHQQNVRYPHIIAQRIQAMKTATPLTTDEAIIAPNTLLVRALVTQLRGRLQAIEDFDTASARYAHMHPDFPLFSSLPGAGPVLAPRLLVAFGAQRDRSPSAGDLPKYAGIAPVTERSGNTSWGHWRLQCPKFLRQTFVEWAGESIRFSFWARVYDEQQRAKGSAHQAAVRARV